MPSHYNGNGGRNNNQYVISGTNTPYTGDVLQINEQYFSTTDGAREHDSQLLELVSNQSGGNNNSIMRTFNAPSTPRYYRPNGTIVPVGAPLHEHSGQIMTGRSMGSNSVVVSTVGREDSRDIQFSGRTSRIRTARRTRARTPRYQRTTTPRTRNGMNGNQNQRQKTRTTNRTTRTRTRTQRTNTQTNTNRSTRRTQTNTNRSTRRTQTNTNRSTRRTRTTPSRRMTRRRGGGGGY